MDETDSSDSSGIGIEMDGWNVVALPPNGIYVTDGDVLYQLGGHTTDTQSSKKIKREYAELI